MANKTENITEGGGHGALAGVNGAVMLACRTLASERTSAFILCSMALLSLAGAIFSQSGTPTSIPDGEMLVFYPGGTGLSWLLSSPLFLALYIALSINLIVSAYARVKSTRSSADKPSESFTPTDTISLTQNGAQATTDIRRALESDLGFRVKTPGDDWVVMEKGLPYGYLFWAYHAAIAICLAGITLTFLFSFNQTVTLTQGLPVDIETGEGGGAPPVGLKLVSGPFTAMYTEKSGPVDPDSLLSRLVASFIYESPVYEQRAGSLYPVDWKLGIAIMNGSVRAEGVLGAGYPLRYKGYTFYLRNLDQTFRVRIDNNPLTLSARNNEEIVIPGIGPGLGLPVRFSTFRRGTLEKPDGSVEGITPYTRMKLSGKSNNGEDLGRLSPGESIFINGTRLTLVEVIEKARLGYRYDPGYALLLRWGGVLLLATMALRLFAPWQMAAYRVDCSGPIVRLHLHIESKGIFASSSRLFRKLERIMTYNDIRPIPLPGGRLK